MTSRMTPFALVLIACTIISTSFISGLFGMAGGMILVGVLLAYFDVATGMVIFSIIQFAANGWRALLWWRFVRWRIFFVYVSGAVISFAVMRTIAIVPGKAAVYLGLCARDPALDRRHIAGGHGARAHDRCRLSPVDAPRDLRGQRSLFGARRHAAGWNLAPQHEAAEILLHRTRVHRIELGEGLYVGF